MSDKFSEYILSVIQEVLRLFEFLSSHRWWRGKTDIADMMRKIKRTDYICEQNVRIIMNWLEEIRACWQKMEVENPEVSANDKQTYNSLEMQVVCIISTMQVKIGDSVHGEPVQVESLPDRNEIEKLKKELEVTKLELAETKRKLESTERELAALRDQYLASIEWLHEGSRRIKMEFDERDGYLENNGTPVSTPQSVNALLRELKSL